jgi:hypothetical protein
VETLPVKALTSARTRRSLFRLTAAAAANIPLSGLAGRSAFAGERRDDDRRRKDRDDRDSDRKYDGTGPNCLLSGTRIATPFGEKPVQELRIGDQVHTHNGPQPIKWIGYNKYGKMAGKPWVENVLPIRAARFAIDDHTPHRDLYLSPAHCVFIDNVLIPVAHLVNDVTITPQMPSDLNTIEYYHIEFEAHEVIYAEGAAVESYLGSDRESFSNFVQFERLYGGECHSNKTPFAPIVGYYGGRDEAKALLRSIVSCVVDVRDPIQTAWDRIAERAGKLRV